ncbi:MAG TPA: hypothetical protein VIQ62_08955 [Burkholderiales bacterium]
MAYTRSLVCWTTALFMAGAASGLAIADKPSWAGGGNKHERKVEGSQHRDYDGDRARGGEHRGSKGGHFGDRQAVVVREFYGRELHSGHCPPGLAKKRNGCLPPGQARKWHMGQPLPRGVVYYDLPPALVIQLGRPPAGHKYVRVAADILLIAVGSSMVVDAIQDLGGM